MVGKGAFGKVRIVERKDTGLTFALKYIRKEEGMFLSPHHTFSIPIGEIADPIPSRSVGECTEYYSRKKNAGTLEPPVPVQLAVQLPGHRIHVSLTRSVRSHRVHVADWDLAISWSI